MSLKEFYAGKADDYFGAPRHDLVSRLDTTSSSSILELGCGSGDTGAVALAQGKAGNYVGIELDPRAAAAARKHFAEVIEGDVESMDLTRFHGRFDALIISEVLEHLTDPWRTLKRLAECVRPGGQVFASSPNVAHWRVVRSLLLGRFDYTETGVMDRTHLRWFTPASYRKMFEAAGLEVSSVEPITPHAPRIRLLNRITRDRFRHLFIVQVMVEGRRP